ncbi:hypothetical protein D3C76_1520800 [compost metagenome]
MQGKCQVHLFISGALGNFQWRGRWHVTGDVEDRSIGHYATGADDGDLAETQVLRIQFQFAEPIERIVQTGNALLQCRLSGEGHLLEVLGLDEHAFFPQYSVT